MKTRKEGLTATYNRFSDPAEMSPDIAELRALHVEMDQAVAAAYGWTDLDLGHGFHETKQGTRYTISEPARREVLDRLLELNHKRYAEEVAQGLHDTGKKPKPPKPKPEPAPLPTQAKPGQQTGFNIDMLAPIPTAPPKPYPTHRPSPPPAAPSFPKSDAPLSAPAAKLRDTLASAPEPMGKSALIAAAGLADSEWLGAIRELQTTGQIEQQGEKRGTKYRWIARHR
jgi:hypothetical protein